MLKIKKVNYEEGYTNGCETCNYGSSYISDIEIIFEDNTSIKIEAEQMYNYTLTESDYMKLLGNSIDLDDFYKNMFEMIENKSYDIEHRVFLKDMILKINGKEIDIIKSCKNRRLVEKVGE